MDIGTISGIATGLSMIAFLGVVAWAWSARRKDTFERLARVPLDDSEGSP
jgi:cytochrome c oxidase cbb3-type subunit 4